MVLNYLEVMMQIVGISLVIAAAGLWAGAGVTKRPKHRDEQTLIGGTIWSQIIIPIGLIISKIVKERVALSVKGYYLVSGILLLWITGIVLLVHETRTYKRRQQRLRANSLTTQVLEIRATLEQQLEPIPYDKVYYGIGLICFLAGAVKMSEFIVFVILAKE